ncbi:hypothetical protein [Adhaeribacter radiodurans]|uniref:Uncharacterized protein n=1 Tax=Adhaeribacter radiodurans TaxID=2745197 RepID=A0A7L7L6G1_9BACT|nr:hypothetical protein [Adhaeribacter radiodurans]QMU27949.1 hypothetical protein HUW48_07775 [Adhaeribacter radiodurans]
MKLLWSFTVFHFILFTLFGLAIAIFDKLDNELFSFLLFSTLVLGISGTVLQFLLFPIYKAVVPVTKSTFFIWVLFIEILFMNIVYYLIEGRLMSYIIVSELGNKVNAFSFKGAIAMHVSILISAFLVSSFQKPKTLL